MARAFWKGSISFGLVEIPVALRPAVRSDDLDLTLLDRKDFSPVGNRRYNKRTGKQIEWSDTVRGYEYEPDEYVVLTDEELKRANVKATQTIEILEFVDRDEIDPLYFDTPYYVEPQKTASKSYALLRATLQKTDKVGIARVVLRTRQHLAALLVRDGVLVLNVLRYAHELAKPQEVVAPAKGTKARVTEAEVRMANALVEGMSGTWEPEKYHDEYRDDVLALVKRKVKEGKTHTVLEFADEEKPRRSSQVMDLMPLLKQSLEQRKSGKTTRRPAARKPARAAARSGRTRKQSA